MPSSKTALYSCVSSGRWYKVMHKAYFHDEPLYKNVELHLVAGLITVFELEHRKVTISFLAKALQMPYSSMSYCVRRIERAGLITRGPAIKRLGLRSEAELKATHKLINMFRQAERRVQRKITNP